MAAFFYCSFLGEIDGQMLNFGVLQHAFCTACAVAAALLVASHACSQDMPNVQQVEEFIAAEKAEYGEMVARV